VLSTIALGTLGGCVLGIVARGWMRLISTDPEFSWSGTVFIVTGFTIFGFGQSIVAVTRSRSDRRSTLTVIRAIGLATMLPLFTAAGAVMLPTVVGGGLAAARSGWHAATRIVCLVLALGPVMFVGRELVDTFGWSLRSLCGVAVMIAIYATIIWATRFAFAAQHDGWRVPRRVRVAALVGVVSAGSLLLASSVGLG
jgi:hypothetical protein